MFTHLVLLAAVAVIVSEASSVTFYLPYRSGGVNYQHVDLYNNNIRLAGRTTMNFRIKAKNDAHILLQRDRTNYNQNVIEVVIGGWGNTKSVIRNSQQGTARDTHQESGIMSTSSFRDFWVSWANGCIKVGKGHTPYSSEVMSWCGLAHACNYVAIGAGYGSDGTYTFMQPVNGGWSSYGSYSACTKSCAGGTQYRTRSCTNPAPAHGGSDCSGSTTQTVSCNTGGCPVNGGWSSYGSYSACTKSCGGGTKYQTRTCTNPAPANGGADCSGSTTQTVSCNTGGCPAYHKLFIRGYGRTTTIYPVNGGWSSYGSYSACTKSCAGGTKYQTRTCTNPAPANGGADCSGSTTQTVSCNTGGCPVDGGWASWSGFSSCTLTCGTGTRYQTRSCTNPAPQNNGADCAGSDRNTVDCNTTPCAIDGGFSAWSSWATCSLTCGSGTQGRARTCTNPAPQHGGRNCTGDWSQTQACNTHHCPIDGGWTSWNGYTTCTLTCGTGTKYRTRSCTDPAPQYNGADCAGGDRDTVNCNTTPCPIDGGFSAWSSWATCSLTCGSGSQGRSRTCTNPPPQYNGANCTAAWSQTQACNTHHCPIDGGWTSWNGYTTCTLTCGTGTKYRTRSCTDPAPQYNGADCAGGDRDTVNCNTTPCPIDGGFSAWSSWATCSLTCGSGSQGRSRTCTNPPPQYNGANCTAAWSQTQACNTHHCPIDGNWAAWSSWSTCPVTCSSNTVLVHRSRTCTNPGPQYNGADCAGSGNDSTPCTINPCPVDGAWSHWAVYGACSVTCLGGVKSRSRACDNPTPAWGGANCTGPASVSTTCNDIGCNQLPEVDGNWGSWLSWQGCSATCDTGVQRRYRACDNPAPDNGGLPCYGDLYQEQNCTTSQTCPVPVDGNWGAWSSGSACTRTCGGGITTKVRECNDPPPSNGGNICAGNMLVSETCNTQTCADSRYSSSYINRCPPGYFTCFSGTVTCIQDLFVCDCEHDCDDASDEQNSWAACSLDMICESAANSVHGWSLMMAVVVSVLVTSLV